MSDGSSKGFTTLLITIILGLSITTLYCLIPYIMTSRGASEFDIDKMFGVIVDSTRNVGKWVSYFTIPSTIILFLLNQRERITKKPYLEKNIDYVVLDEDLIEKQEVIETPLTKYLNNYEDYKYDSSNKDSVCEVRSYLRKTMNDNVLLLGQTTKVTELSEEFLNECYNKFVITDKVIEYDRDRKIINGINQYLYFKMYNSTSYSETKEEKTARLSTYAKYDLDFETGLSNELTGEIIELIQFHQKFKEVLKEEYLKSIA